MDIYSYHEGEEKERGAGAPLRHPRHGFKYFKERGIKGGEPR